MALPAPCESVLDLPAALQAECLGWLSFQERCQVAPRVCTAWRDLVRSHGGQLWRHIDLSSDSGADYWPAEEAGISAFWAHLRKIGPHTRSLRLNNNRSGPGQYVNVPAFLTAFPHLHSLSLQAHNLGSRWQWVPREAARHFGRLCPQLRSLSVSDIDAGAVLEAVAGLPHLTCLSALALGRIEPHAFAELLKGVAALPDLSRLWLDVEGGDDLQGVYRTGLFGGNDSRLPVQVPANLAALPRVSSLGLGACVILPGELASLRYVSLLEVRAKYWSDLLPGVAGLGALRSLCATLEASTAVVDGDWGFLSRLTALTVSCDRDSLFSGDAMGPATGHDSLPPLPRLARLHLCFAVLFAEVFRWEGAPVLASLVLWGVQQPSDALNLGRLAVVEVCNLTERLSHPLHLTSLVLRAEALVSLTICDRMGLTPGLLAALKGRSTLQQLRLCVCWDFFMGLGSWWDLDGQAHEQAAVLQTALPRLQPGHLILHRCYLRRCLHNNRHIGKLNRAGEEPAKCEFGGLCVACSTGGCFVPPEDRSLSELLSDSEEEEDTEGQGGPEGDQAV